MPKPTPYKYEQIASRLQARISSGRYPDGRLPREVDLVHEVGASRVTVNRAVGLLAQRGIVRRVKKRGTFIVGHDSQQMSLLHQVGVVMQTRGHFYGDIWAAICDQLMRRSLFPVSLSPFSSDIWDAEGNLPSNPAFPSAMRKLLFAPLRGVIYSGSDFYLHPVLESLRERTAVCVHCFDAAGPVPSQSVLMDYGEGIRLVVRHLVGLGHRHIGFLGILAPNHPIADPSHRANNPQCRMKAAFETCMAENDLADAAVPLLMSRAPRPGTITSDDELRGVLSRPNRPTAIVCEKDCDAIRLVILAMEMGLRVPEDVALTGLYNTPWAEESPVPLTTVDFDVDALACRAVDLLVGDGVQTKPFYTRPRLVARASSAVPVSDRDPSRPAVLSNPS